MDTSSVQKATLRFLGASSLAVALGFAAVAGAQATGAQAAGAAGVVGSVGSVSTHAARSAPQSVRADAVDPCLVGGWVLTSFSVMATYTTFTTGTKTKFHQTGGTGATLNITATGSGSTSRYTNSAPYVGTLNGSPIVIHAHGVIVSTFTTSNGRLNYSNVTSSGYKVTGTYNNQPLSFTPSTGTGSTSYSCTATTLTLTTSSNTETETFSRVPSSFVGMAATPTGGGYWLVNTQGRVSTFGNAVAYGTMAGHQLNAPIAHIVSTPSGQGYWLVAGDGGTFAFGNAGFFGSMGGKPLNAPVVDIAPTANGQG